MLGGRRGAGGVRSCVRSIRGAAPLRRWALGSLSFWGQQPRLGAELCFRFLPTHPVVY